MSGLVRAAARRRASGTWRPIVTTVLSVLAASRHLCANLAPLNVLGGISRPLGGTLRIRERAVDNVAVLDLDGRLVLGDGDETLKQKIHALLTGGRTHVVLNLADVSYVDSAGLGSLVAVCLDVRKHGGGIKLHSASKRLRDLFVIARLVNVLEISDSEAQAVGSFRVNG